MRNCKNAFKCCKRSTLIMQSTTPNLPSDCLSRSLLRVFIHLSIYLPVYTYLCVCACVDVDERPGEQMDVLREHCLKWVRGMEQQLEHIATGQSEVYDALQQVECEKRDLEQGVSQHLTQQLVVMQVEYAIFKHVVCNK